MPISLMRCAAAYVAKPNRPRQAIKMVASRYPYQQCLAAAILGVEECELVVEKMVFE
jgi:hypothetical protein